MVIEGEHATGALLDPTTPPGGMTMPPPVEAMRRPSQPASSAQWHVSVDGAESGPYSLTQIVQRLQSGDVPWDAYLWRDGFAEWMGVQQCSEITDRIAPPAVAPAPPPMVHDDAKTRVHQSGAFPPVSGYSAPSVPVRASVPARASVPVPVPVPSRAVSARPGASMHSTPAMAAARPSLSQAPLLLEEPAPLQSMVRPSSRPTSRPGQSVPPQQGLRAAPLGSQPPTVSNDAVLFSASQLGPVARPGGMSQAPQSRPGFAGGDSSGLVDIAALASLARQSSAPPVVPHATMRPSSMPSTPSVQLQPLPAALDSLAPTSRRPSSSNKTLPLAILASSAMVASATFAAILITRSDPQAPAAAPVPAAAAQPVAPQPQPVAAPTPEPAPAAVPAVPGDDDKEGVPVAAEPGSAAPAEPAVAEAAAVAPVEPAVVEEAAPVAAVTRAPGGKRPAKARPRPAAAAKAAPAEEEEPLLAEKEAPAKGAKAGKAAPAASDSSDMDDLLLADRPAKPAADAKPAATDSSDVDDLLAAPAAAKPQPAAKQSIDDLLDGAVAKGSKPAAAKAAAPAAAVAAESGVPEAPTREDVLRAIKGVTPAVRSCAGGQSGVAKVAITVSGSTGAVTSANANGVEEPIKSCIEGAVRDAEFPTFSKPTFRVDYPFKF